MVASASRTQRTVFGFLAAADGLVLVGADFEFALRRPSETRDRPPTTGSSTVLRQNVLAWTLWKAIRVESDSTVRGEESNEHSWPKNPSTDEDHFARPQNSLLVGLVGTDKLIHVTV